MSLVYLHHRIRTAPRAWRAVGVRLIADATRVLAREGGTLFGVWRAQIGRPRDELTAITAWPARDPGTAVMSVELTALDDVEQHETRPMIATVRPLDETPPTRQGSYAFRYFETPASDWSEFLTLCTDAWPTFESSFDSQVLGLWRFEDDSEQRIRSLLLTRRPDLAMWERSKIPRNAAETAMRNKLSRRYDLCTDTVVYTSTLLSASDREDTVRWA